MNTLFHTITEFLHSSTSTKFVIATLLCLSLFILLIIGYGEDMEFNLKDTISARSVENPVVIQLSFSAAVLLLPILLDNIIDGCFYGFNIYLIERIFLLSSISITFFIQSFSSSTKIGTAIFLTCFYCQIQILAFAGINALQKCTPTLYPWNRVIILLVFVYTYTILAEFHLLFLSADLRLAVIAFRYISVITYIVACFIAFIDFYLKWRASKTRFLLWFDSLQSVLQSSVIISVIIIIGIIVYITCTSLFTNNKANFATETRYYIAYFTVSTFVYISIAIVPYRLERIKAKKIESDLDTKKSFVQYISHELRTPISIITTGLDLLEEQIKTNAPAHEILAMVDDIRKPCSTSISVLDNLLQYEKLESGVLSLKKTVQDPSLFLEVTIAPFKLLSRSKNIDFKITTKIARGRHVYVNIDGGKMSQVLGNIITNAIKFTPISGSVVVKSYVEYTSLVVEVIDSGIGLTVTEQHELFGNMVPYHPKSHEKGEGSGLGLVICQKIIDMHGGSIGVSSAGEGRGCSFRFTLPLCAGENESGVRLSKSSLLSRSIEMFRVTPEALVKDNLLDASIERDERENTLKALRILVVDDSALNRKMLVKRLSQGGHQCMEAEDGDVAVEAVKGAMHKGVGIFDVITMDNVMPRMRGPDATREIRKLGYTGIIMGVTGNVLDEDKKAFIEHGVDVVMPKPFDMAAFTSNIIEIRRNRIVSYEIISGKSKRNPVNASSERDLLV